jgi:hypothetical protein
MGPGLPGLMLLALAGTGPCFLRKEMRSKA